MMFCPSMWPSSRSASRIASARAESVAASVGDRYPIRGTLFACCASADEQSAKSMAQRVRTVIILFMFVSALSTRHSTLDTRPFSLDHLIRPCQHIGRNRKADLLGGLQIDDELEFY